MSRPQCAKIQQQLPWLVNGTLNEDEQRPLWQHVAKCAPCREELKGWARTAARLRERDPEPDPALLQELWKTIRHQTVDVEIRPGDSWKVLPFSLSATGILGWAVKEAIMGTVASPFPAIDEI